MCRNYVRDLGATLFPETLVWLFRASQYRDRDLLEVVMERLLGNPDQSGKFRSSVKLVIWRDEVAHWWRELEAFLVGRARRLGFAESSDDTDEFRARSHVHILLHMRAGAERRPFWEVYFSSALRYVVLDVVREIHRAQDVSVRLSHGMPAADPARLPQGTLSTDELERRARAFEEAMLALPEKERVILELLYLDPPPENGKRTQEEVADILQVTVKTVYNRLRNVRARLKDDPRLAAIRELDAVADEGDSPHSTGEMAEADDE